jgi:hypothetical protein
MILEPIVAQAWLKGWHGYRLHPLPPGVTVPFEGSQRQYACIAISVSNI